MKKSPWNYPIQSATTNVIGQLQGIFLLQNPNDKELLSTKINFL